MQSASVGGRTLNIAFLCADIGIPVFGTKGASVHVRELVHALEHEGHRVTVFSPSVAGADQAPRSINVVNVPLSDIFQQINKQLKQLDAWLGFDTRIRQDLRNLCYNRTFFDALKPKLIAGNFDCIYERYTIGSDAGVALAGHLKLPHLLEVNAPLVQEQERFRGLELKRIARKLERRIVQSSDHIFVVSDALETFALNAGAAPAAVTQLPNGVNPHAFDPNTAERERTRQALSVGDKTVIGFVGSLKPWHGTDALVRAVCELSGQVENIHLLIVGDGPQRSQLEALASALGPQATLTGNVPHQRVPDYIAAMDIAVAPYPVMEDFYFSPIKVGEYLAMGKAVVAANIGQMSHTLQHDETGLLYPPGDERKLQSALRRLVQDATLRQRLGQAGRQWVVENRTWAQNAAAVTTTMRALLDERAATALPMETP